LLEHNRFALLCTLVVQINIRLCLLKYSATLRSQARAPPSFSIFRWFSLHAGVIVVAAAQEEKAVPRAIASLYKGGK
jgi:hypothetical protein